MRRRVKTHIARSVLMLSQLQHPATQTFLTHLRSILKYILIQLINKIHINVLIFCGKCQSTVIIEFYYVNRTHLYSFEQKKV